MNAASTNERRAAVRRQFTAKGLFLSASGQTIEVRTFDASELGLGLVHFDVLPPTGSAGRLRVAWLTQSGPIGVEATVQVRHTVMSRGGELRTGVLFTAISDAHRVLLERHINGRVALDEGELTTEAMVAARRR